MIMKSRLPRKRKKVVKAIVSRNSARKVVMSALCSAQSLMQIAVLRSRPIPAHIHIEKGVAIVEVVTNTAQAIQQIMSAPPNHWREFIK